MGKIIVNQYNPDYVSPPGDTLLETIETIGMTPEELAKKTGIEKKDIKSILKGKGLITPDIALQFEKILGIPAGFWNNRERHYRESIEKRKEKAQIREKQRYQITRQKKTA